MARFCTRSLTILALTLLLAAPALAAESISGKVVSADNNQLTVSSGDQNHTFEVTNDTKITIKGGEGKLSDLKAGQEVTVVAEKDGDKMVAKSIAAT
jgi:azurin